MVTNRSGGSWRPKISVVVTALNEGQALRRTVEQLRVALGGNGEILVVDDGSTDGSTRFFPANTARLRVIRSNQAGVAKARNRGAVHARGDFIVFCDAHLNLKPGWWEPMVELLSEASVGAVAPGVSNMRDKDAKGFGMQLTGPDLQVRWLDRAGNRPCRVPLLPGCCLAMRREVFEATGGFDEGMIRWGSEDVELSLRLWLLGYELWVVPEVEVAHLFRSKQPYRVSCAEVLHNRLRLAFVHLGRRRVERVIQALVNYQHFAPALALALESDFPLRRAALRAKKVRDEEWFFRRFNQQW